MKDSQRLAQMIRDSRRFLSDHERASLDQLVQGGEVIEWQPVAKRIFVALLVLESKHTHSNDINFIRSLYEGLNHDCDVELFRLVFID